MQQVQAQSSCVATLPHSLPPCCAKTPAAAAQQQAQQQAWQTGIHNQPELLPLLLGLLLLLPQPGSSLHLLLTLTPCQVLICRQSNYCLLQLLPLLLGLLLLLPLPGSPLQSAADVDSMLSVDVPGGHF